MFSLCNVQRSPTIAIKMAGSVLPLAALKSLLLSPVRYPKVSLLSHCVSSKKDPLNIPLLTLPKPHFRYLLIPPILQIPKLLHQPTHHRPHLSPFIRIHLRAQLPGQQLQLRFILRVLDFVFFDDVALDAAAALGAARRFGKGLGGDGLGGAEVEGGAVGEEWAGFCDFNVALVSTL